MSDSGSPVPLHIGVSVQIEIREGGVVLSACNNGVEIARGVGSGIPEAVPALVSYFKDLQEAAIDVLRAGGMLRMQDDPPKGEPS